MLTKECVLISACLLGEKVRYDGSSKPSAAVCALTKHINYKPICPEQAGGLSTPRAASEIVGRQVLTSEGQNVTREFLSGAQASCISALEHNARLAIFKAKSPSCGSGKIYDGTFSGVLTDGWGISAKALKQAGVFVVDEQYVEQFSLSKHQPLQVFVDKNLDLAALDLRACQNKPLLDIAQVLPDERGILQKSAFAVHVSQHTTRIPVYLSALIGASNDSELCILKDLGLDQKNFTELKDYTSNVSYNDKLLELSWDTITSKMYTLEQVLSEICTLLK